jgi:predicted aspartyl protease
VLAKIDMGAGYSSIDEDLAEDLSIDLNDPEDTVEIESANGEEKRSLVRVRIRVAEKTLDTRATVTDRSRTLEGRAAGQPGSGRVPGQA